MPAPSRQNDKPLFVSSLACIENQVGCRVKEETQIYSTMMNPLWLLLFLTFLPLVIGNPLDDPGTLVTVVSSLLAIAEPSLFGLERPGIDYDRSSPKKRKRRKVCSVFDELGPYYVRRAFRMKEESFWKLHRSLKKHIKGGSIKRKEGGKKNTENIGAVNGVIPSSVRLAAAVRYFAGGDPLDTCVVCGISHTEVHDSAWYVVDAVNECPDLDIKFPRNHNVQRRLAAAFKERSQANFDCCAGAIDGILIWIEKPTKEQCELSKCGQLRFYCGRKSKYGLNMQGVCDSEGRFLDVDISHPGTTSDYLAFGTSLLKKKLEESGFLAPGLCLFGDLAYPNRSYLATPFKNVKSGTKDDYNYYHSQVRIKIECAFGMLVNRWGILRKALSARISLRKVGALVIVLCKLHNFCISERIRLNGSEDDDFTEPLAQDGAVIANGGGIPLEPSARDPDLNQRSPEQLLHGGQHLDDVTENLRRQLDRAENGNEEVLPRDLMHERVAEQGLARPLANRWRMQ